MKAKDLAKFLLQNPEAEVITYRYYGINTIDTIENAELYVKGRSISGIEQSSTNTINSNGKCNVDVIYLT